MTTTSWQPPRLPAPPRQRRVPAPVPVPGAGGRRLRRALRRCRRPLAALLLAAATGLVVLALLPPDVPAGGVEVLVAGSDLPAGAPVGPGVRAASLPPSAVPQGALGPDDLGAGARASGARLAAPVRAGEVITDVRLSGDDVLASLRPGQVAVPVGVSSPLPEGLVSPGARVAVLAAAPADAEGFDVPEGLGAGPGGSGGSGGSSGVLVSTATVLVVSSDAVTTGLLGGGGRGTAVVLALDEADAARVAAASATGVVLARAA